MGEKQLKEGVKARWPGCSLQKCSIPFNEWDLGTPVVEGARDEDLLASISPADDSGTSLLHWLC